MDNNHTNDGGRRSTPERGAIARLKTSLKKGRDWPTSLLEAMAAWTTPEETYRGRRYNYLIEGEAFDWLSLAERLCHAVDGLIPEREKEELLFGGRGRFPESFDASQFRELLGTDKYRGYLNYFYGVTVEEALQLEVEGEVQKRRVSKGNLYQEDFSEEAFARIYHAPRSTLLGTFRQEKGYPAKRSMSVCESKEFTYWLFKHRLRISDKAKVASDTRKGLKQLQEMASTPHTVPGVSQPQAS